MKNLNGWPFEPLDGDIDLLDGEFPSGGGFPG